MTDGVGDTRSDLYPLAAEAFEALSSRRVTPGDELERMSGIAAGSRAPGGDARANRAGAKARPPRRRRT